MLHRNSALKALFAAQEQQFNARFDAQEQRQDDFEARMDRFETRMDRMEDKLDKVLELVAIQHGERASTARFWKACSVVHANCYCACGSHQEFFSLISAHEEADVWLLKTPNILWICTDQQRYDTIGALGNPYVSTPNIDSLVAEGVAFTHAYCQSPICTPSRASFLTGMYPERDAREQRRKRFLSRDLSAGNAQPPRRHRLRLWVDWKTSPRECLPTGWNRA